MRREPWRRLACAALLLAAGCAAWPVEERFRRPPDLGACLLHDAKHTLLFVPDTALEIAFAGKDVLSDLADLPEAVLREGPVEASHRALSRLAGDAQLAFHGIGGMSRGVLVLSAPEFLTGARTFLLGAAEMIPDAATGMVAVVLAGAKEPFRSAPSRPAEPGPSRIERRPRVTTVVIDEFDRGSDAPLGRAVEWLGVVFVRRHLLKRSDHVVWLVGRDATRDRFGEELRRAAQRDQAADVVVLAHGTVDVLVLAHGEASSGTILLRQPIRSGDIASLGSVAGLRLRCVAQITCYGDKLHDAWAKAGAKTVHSHRGRNKTHMYFIAKFLRALSDGETVAAASRRARRKMEFESAWTPVFWVDRRLGTGAPTRRALRRSGPVVIGGDPALRVGPLDGPPPPREEPPRAR